MVLIRQAFWLVDRLAAAKRWAVWLGSGPCPRVCLLVAVLAVPKLQALVYDFLPSTTAVFSYAIGSRKLSANEQFFVGAQTIWVVSLLQTTQIKQGVSFMAANKIYTSTNETTIVWIETELFFFSFFFFPGVDASLVYVRASALGSSSSMLLYVHGSEEAY